MQAPAPLHAPTGVAVPAAHEALPQTSEADGYWHVVSFPSHVAPHVPLPEHAVRGVPLAFGCTAPTTTVHVPRLVDTSHAWHWLLHAVLQQTPSTQFPDEHCVPAVHTVPLLARHLPTDPVKLHASPGPLHASLQHTPFAQTPLVHAVGSLAEHVAPFASFGTHCPALQ